MKQRPYQSTDLPSVIEIYTVSIHSLAVSYYSPEQIAAWAPVRPDAAHWQERLSHLHTIVAELTAFLRVSLPTHTTATSTFFSLIPLLPVVVLPRASTSASSRHCVRSAPRELRPTPVLPPGRSSTATVSKSMQSSASSAEALTFAGSPCTNNFAMNEIPNQVMPSGIMTLEKSRKGLEIMSQHGAMTAGSSQIVSRHGRNASHRNEEAALKRGTQSLNETMRWLNQPIASRSFATIENAQRSASRFSRIIALPEYFRSDTPGSARSCDIYPNRLSL